MRFHSIGSCSKRWPYSARPCGASAAVFGVTCADPVTSPPFPPLLKSLSLPYGYLKYFLTFAALPLLWPIAGVKRLGIGGGVAEALHVWRYVLPQTLRKVRGGGMDIAALFLCVTPLWTLAVLTTVSLFIYYFRMGNVNDAVFLFIGYLRGVLARVFTR